jgi:hypothetical protein
MHNELETRLASVSISVVAWLRVAMTFMVIREVIASMATMAMISSMASQETIKFSAILAITFSEDDLVCNS